MSQQMTIITNLQQIKARIERAEQQYQRPVASTMLLAVSKKQSVAAIVAAFQAGQSHFGENYLQEALPKITALAEYYLDWHFIGPIQSNKTKAIAEHFSWVHSVDSLKIAQRLNNQRPDHMPPLNVCLQVNISNESTKAGVLLQNLQQLVEGFAEFPQLRLRGLMAIPKFSENFIQQREPYSRLGAVFDELNLQGMQLDTLSMGMSNDLEAAIAEGATIVRVGTGIFGPRD